MQTLIRIARTAGAAPDGGLEDAIGLAALAVCVAALLGAERLL